MTAGSEARLTAALTSGRYALVGAGQLGALSLALWPEGVPRPEFVLDSVRTGTLDGIAIRDLAAHRPEPGITYLLAAFKMPPAAIHAIFARLGQRDIVTVYDFFEQFIPALFTNGWRNLNPSAEVQARLAALPGLHADAESRAVCAAVTAWRYRRELIDAYPVEDEADKYYLTPFGRAGQHYDVVYDGGPYDLHLLEDLARAGVGWDRVVAFEPDPVSQSLCAATARRWEAEAGAPVTVDARALSDRTGQGRFLANGLLSSRLIAEAGLEHPDLVDMPTCSLDTVHRELFGADDAPRRILVKLHIEGAERDALEGARDMLTRHRVDVLVNLSHDERSFLEIAPYLAGFGRFDLHLRSRALFGEGLTLFARCRA